MTTRALIEKLQNTHLPSVEIHLNVLLTANPGGTNYYGNPTLREGQWQMQLSPVGRQLMDRIEYIPGLGSLMCSSYSFQFNMALAFDYADILRDVLDAIQQVIGDTLEISVQLRKDGPVVPIQQPSELPAMLRELNA